MATATLDLNAGWASAETAEERRGGMPQRRALTDTTADLFEKLKAQAKTGDWLDELLRDERLTYRAHEAVGAPTATDRQRVLAVSNPARRQVGGNTMGAGTHKWRSVSQEHVRESRGVQAPVVHPLADRRPQYTFPKSQRMANHTSEQVMPLPKYRTPAGADYQETRRNTSFMHGDTVAFGANHPVPSKDALGEHVNPVHVSLTKHKSSAKYSFSRSRRCMSLEDFVRVGATHNAAKSDRMNLSPGPGHYQLHTTFGLSRG